MQSCKVSETEDFLMTVISPEPNCFYPRCPPVTISPMYHKKLGRSTRADSKKIYQPGKITPT